MRGIAAIAMGCVLLCGAAAAQQVRTYTATQTGSGLLPLGYPVPRPIASLTPVDGYRDYASLEARLHALAMAHPDLTAHQAGTTTHGHPLWAYVVSRPGNSDVEGRSKPAFFINATTHAREWGAPEVATYLVERMMADAGGNGLVRYLLDNTRLVTIPVHNIDGLQQTQRYHDRVVVGRDPCSPSVWPRDGRMRRKNMRGVDTVIGTFDDHLLGVDLNRNHPPFHNTLLQPGNCGSGSSTNVNSLVYHGSGPHSEAESMALRAAAALGPVSRMRLGIDIHSFSRVFFSSNTARARLNEIQSRLLSVLSLHHATVPTHDRPVHNVWYLDAPDPANRGMGVAAEYFAYEWLVPAWTLELEPQNSATEYGGYGVSHDGFILPESQIRRVREAWAETHLAAFYFMAGPPHLARVRLHDADDGALLYERGWHYQGNTQRRELRSLPSAALSPGRRVRVELAFSKPMRHRVGGTIAQLPGSSVALAPRVLFRRGGAGAELDTSNGRWLENGLRYRDDTFAFEFTLPGDGNSAQPFDLEVQAQDMVGLALDSDPSTPVDWLAGAWSGWNGTSGVEGDHGGSDILSASFGADVSEIELVHVPPVVGEGDRLRVRLRRAVPSTDRVAIVGEAVGEFLARPGFSPPPPPAPFVEWLPGETGERVLDVPVPDDVEVQGARAWSAELTLARHGAAAGVEATAFASVSTIVLDNDEAGRPVFRLWADSSAGIHSAFDALAASGSAEPSVVFDGGTSYRSYTPRQTTACFLDRPILPAGATLFGNGALFANSDCNGGPLRVEDGRSAAFVRLDIDALAIGANASLTYRGGTLGTLQAGGDAVLSQARVRRLASSDGARVELLSTLAGPFEDTGAVLGNGHLQLDSSTVFGPRVAHAVLQIGHATTLGLHNALLQQHPEAVSPTGTPLVPPLCSQAGASSSGFNIASDATCGLMHPTDRQNVALPGFWSAGDMAPTGAAIDSGPLTCGPTDARGAPRPQALTNDSPPRCDVGAIELGVNPYRGMWIPDRPGHGIDLQTSGNRLFISWYTYGDDGEPTLYQALAPLTGPQWRATLKRARRSHDGSIVMTEVGSVGIDFIDDTQATLHWRFGAGPEGSEGLQAYLFGGEPRVEITGTWYPPVESGNGATVVRRGETTAALLYYYDASGALRWALGTGSADDVVDIPLLSFTGFCPDCDAATRPATAAPAGTMRVQMLTPERLRIDSDISYPGAAGGRWQRERVDLVPLNDLVDNERRLH
jgi:hypothetical protein